MTGASSDRTAVSDQQQDPMGKIKTAWSNCQQPSVRISEAVPGVYTDIRKALMSAIIIGSATDNKGQGPSRIEKQIKEFLQGGEKAREEQGQKQEKADKLDNRILWIILSKAVEDISADDSTNEVERFEREANMRIIYMIVDIAPWLAFDNPASSTHTSTETWEQYRIQQRCKFQRIHNIKAKEWTSTPFHEAAANNNSEAIDYML